MPEVGHVALGPSGTIRQGLLLARAWLAIYKSVYRKLPMIVQVERSSVANQCVFSCGCTAANVTRVLRCSLLSARHVHASMHFWASRPLLTVQRPRANGYNCCAETDEGV